MPVSAGLTQMSGYTLIGIYLATRLLKTQLVKLPQKPTWLLLLATVLGVVVALSHFGFYNSPFQFLFAAFMFLAFKELKLPKAVCKILRVISPSVFAVYVIHTNIAGIHLMKILDAVIISKWQHGILVTFLVGLTVFCVSLMIDLPRRMLFQFYKLKLSR